MECGLEIGIGEIDHKQHNNAQQIVNPSSFTRSEAAAAMATTAAVHATAMHNPDVTGSPKSATETLKRNHDNQDKEDEATTPPSKTLKHTKISDTDPHTMDDDSPSSGANLAADVEDAAMPSTAATPEPAHHTDIRDEDMRDQITSPKKKRGREQDDDTKEVEVADENEVTDAKSPDTATANGGRTTRSAPEKKRPRDSSTEAIELPSEKSDTDNIESGSKSDSNIPSTTSPKPAFGGLLEDKSQSSSSAFANSTFGALSSKPSGFAALAGKPSVFGGGAAAAPFSGFGSMAAKATATDISTAKLSFGGPLTADTTKLTSGFGSTGTGGFGTLSSGFGGGAGFGGFGSVSGQTLSSFAAAGKPEIFGAEKQKPVKAFGAPESGSEEESEGAGSDEGGQSDDEECSVADEDKKKLRSKIVPINDGEEGEVTLLSFRAKLFAIGSKENGWKERGVGILKLNVPKNYVDYDKMGAPIPGTYDPSARDYDENEESGPEPTPARLVMRQENTHRVILNTAILKALKFEEKAANTSVQILFTAFEDTKPINMLLRMNETNARNFTSEIASIQNEL